MTAYELMEKAGKAVADEAEKMLKGKKKVSILIGPGQNGGDGLVAARLLKERGYDVTGFIIGGIRDVKSNAWINMDKFVRMKGAVVECKDLEGFKRSSCAFNNADLIIDAIFGIGLDRALESPYREIIPIINSAGKLILSVDVPSGIHADSGRLMGTAIMANKTITFAAVKEGLLKDQGLIHAGKVVVADIGIPVEG
ncbi:MAG: NAD(P)H-hydrate epimerase [Candidatus Margulisiibacteriota bacterium]